MKITVTEHIFREAFRQERPEQFSYEALGKLFEYLDEYEQEPDLEFDVVAICCDFAEYTDLEEFQQNYGLDGYETIEDIENVTSVIRINDTAFIIQQF